MSKKHAQGFTLVELIVVIVILGILAATALPRFIHVPNEARVAAVNGFAGGLRSAVAVVQARYMASGGTGTTATMVDGTVVTVTATSGIPVGTAAGIGSAMQSIDGFTPTYAATTIFAPVNAGPTPATCRVEYVAATGAVTALIAGC
ncbi:MAG: pilin protein MshA [Pseudomonadota bacterium]|nr:pilin protein MshA [Pseudomonadota bacterium]